jgi:hypothetical protein
MVPVTAPRRRSFPLWPSGPVADRRSFGARRFRHPASGLPPCPHCTPVAGVPRRLPPSGVSAIHPLVGPVSLSAGSPGGLRFWAHPSPRPIRRTGCSLVERRRGVTPFPRTVCRCGQGGTLRRGGSRRRPAAPAPGLSLRAGRHSSPGGWGVNPAYDTHLRRPSSESCWTQPNRGWLVGVDGDSTVPSLALPVRSCARRGSRPDSGLPPFAPCTAPREMVRFPGVGHAVTGSPPGWESHPHGYRVVRGRGPSDRYLHL